MIELRLVAVKRTKITLSKFRKYIIISPSRLAISRDKGIEIKTCKRCVIPHRARIEAVMVTALFNGGQRHLLTCKYTRPKGIPVWLVIIQSSKLHKMAANVPNNHRQKMQDESQPFACISSKIQPITTIKLTSTAKTLTVTLPEIYNYIFIMHHCIPGKA